MKKLKKKGKEEIMFSLRVNISIMEKINKLIHENLIYTSDGENIT